ncbi:MAG: ATP-binding protein [Lachnospiraceae bacterium]|nr:ATP-binding protein [Lachnospiraceae bacterium]
MDKLMEIRIKAEISEIPGACDAVAEAAAGFGMSMKGQQQMAVVLDELLSNIAYYAYPEEKGLVTIQAETEGEFFRIRVRDSGIPFNPLDCEEPDLSLDSEDRPLGGLGIFMVKKLTDGISYVRHEEENILTVLKKF